MSTFENIGHHSSRRIETFTMIVSKTNHLRSLLPLLSLVRLSLHLTVFAIEHGLLLRAENGRTK